MLIDSSNIFSNQKFNEGEPAKDPIFLCEKFKVMRVSLKKGLEIPPHSGEHPVFFLVLKGRGYFTTGKGVIELGENDFVSLDSNEKRGMKAIEDLIVLAVRD